MIIIEKIQVFAILKLILQEYEKLIHRSSRQNLLSKCEYLKSLELIINNDLIIFVFPFGSSSIIHTLMLREKK